MSPSVTDEERRPDVVGQSKVKFIQRIKDKYGFAPGISPSYGLLYLSSILKNIGHTTFYLDGNIHNIDTILNFIYEKQIDLVGVSTLSFNWEAAKKNIRVIKRRNPSVMLVIGGVNVTCRKSDCLKESPETDIAVYGEAEESFPEVIRRLENGITMHNVPGVIFRDNGVITENIPAVPVKDLDTIPYPDLSALGDDFKRFRPAPMFYKNLPHASIFASRGCPFKCTFCLSEQKLRKRDPLKVVDEIEYYIKEFGIRSMTFYDETLTANKTWIKEICSEINNRKLRFYWSANVRADCVTPDIVKIMKGSGCWQMLFGVESGVQKNLITIQKGETVDQIRDAVNMVSREGVETLGMFMFGIPGETYEEGLETIKFACNLPLNYAIFTNITPYPGSKLYDQVKDEPGFRGLDKLTTPVKINYVPASMTEDELRTLLKKAYRSFYYRPAYIAKRLAGIRDLEDIRKNLRGFLQLWN